MYFMIGGKFSISNENKDLKIHLQMKRKVQEESPSNKTPKLTTKKVDITNLSPITPLENGYFEINKVFLEDSRLVSDRNIILYPRQDFQNELSFLKNDVLEKSQRGWILGSPGSGKSITAYFFLLELVQSSQYTVTWIHFSPHSFPKFVHYQAGENCKESGVIRDEEQLRNILDSESEKRHFVVLDGYVGLREQDDTLMHCNGWVEDIDTRRLVVVCPCISRGKSSFDEDVIHRVKLHYVSSWKIEEYQEAVKNKIFFESIRDFLDSSIDPDVPPDELIESKFYFAGGSVYFMFCLKNQQVVELLDESVRAIDDPLPYLRGWNGEQANFVVNRLFSIYIDKSRMNWTHSIVSQYAATQLAMKFGPSFVQTLAKALR